MVRITDLLTKSLKPLIWAGNGIRLAGEAVRFWSFIQKTQIPFVTTWSGADLVPTCHHLNTGIVGISGQRGANKAVHNADLLLVLGSHLSLPQTSTLTDQFSPNSKKIVVNIDQDQLDNLTVKVDLPICADLRDFFSWAELNHLKAATEDWLEECRGYKALNNLEHLPKSEKINSNSFNDIMTRMLPPGSCMVIDGGGTALYTGFQSSHIKADSRLICSTAMSAMGSGLPEAIGACLARPNGDDQYGTPKSYKLTTCLIGDGSFMLNMQELQTIKHHNLPIKIFVINNGGYLAIRHTQDGFLEGRHCGTSEKDLSFPSIARIAMAFGIPYCKADENLEETIGWALDSSGPTICEVFCPEDQPQAFKQGFKKEGDRFVPHDLSEMEPFV